MKIKYKLNKIQDRIYHCVINDTYDLAMTFCRVQEFYESPFKQIRGKNFKILDFMKLYSQKRGECFFGYPIDWCGFNIPGPIIEDCYFGKIIEDSNYYDNVIEEIHFKVISDIGEEHNQTCPKYYLIATEAEDEDTLKHEICHALYYVHDEYKKKANSIVKKLSRECYDKLTLALTELGYTKKVFKDELQAYITTGISALEYKVKLTKQDKKNINDLKIELLQNFNNFFN